MNATNAHYFFWKIIFVGLYDMRCFRSSLIRFVFNIRFGHDGIEGGTSSPVSGLAEAALCRLVGKVLRKYQKSIVGFH